MVKSPEILVPAYDDTQGVTARFNKNILRRINREFSANFDLDSFRHVAEWNPVQSRMEIFLESIKTQVVTLSLAELAFDSVPASEFILRTATSTRSKWWNECCASQDSNWKKPGLMSANGSGCTWPGLADHFPSAFTTFAVVIAWPTWRWA